MTVAVPIGMAGDQGQNQRPPVSEWGYYVFYERHLQTLLKTEGAELMAAASYKAGLAGKIIGKYTRKSNPVDLDALARKMAAMVKSQQAAEAPRLGHRVILLLELYAPGKRVYRCEYSPRNHYLYIDLIEPVDPRTVKGSQRYRLRGKNRWVAASAILKTDKPFEQMIRRMAKQWDPEMYGEP
ncbi:MAG: hypothetical protein IT210_10540 [Armatimonadetes bacterium]|nr:hypothetical protein [Armatimonadota bacterium]